MIQGMCLVQNLFWMNVEEGKVFQLCHKSEKLAIAFRLINTAPGTPLRIRKNLQVFAMIATLSQSSVQE